MYSSKRAANILKKDVAFLVPGIYDDVYLVGIRYEQSQKGKRFLEFKFEKENKSLTHTEWEPLKGDQTAEEFEKKCDKQFTRIDQILKCFYPNSEDRAFDGDSFEDCAKWVVNKVENADKENTPLRVKIVYNKDGFTTLPKYATYTFIEPMSVVNEGKSLIRKLNIDLFEKPIVSDTEQESDNPLISNVASSNSGEEISTGLPF